ncbi:hypothetical protein R4P64_30390 [Rhodococcus sp. IEGM 1366]|uniref:hypothetical protein n=1 Tax=Rhodococcus sp. IEGM 1366 TaxID=3082223 RepID=UPI002955A3A7|nr:hypothetical protein [Rhodococcus sp. IEGM 1366]MDV8070837.1 hypothetical protein [Rhodococcus sp. IEGM 1366]
MTLEEKRDNRSPTTWLTAALWALTFSFVYLMIGLLLWWTALVFVVAGVTLTYFWWKNRQRSPASVLFGFTCACFAALALVTSGASMFVPISAAVDSVGPRRVVCGSVINPVQADELTVTTVGSSEPMMQSWPEIPQASMERVCSNRLSARGGRAVGLTLVGLLLAARATGHLITPASSGAVGARTRQV